MLRGAIDLISAERIGGWIYASFGNVRSQTVLAFVDGQCVGSGSVEGFREDLANAGLGDGYSGFDFPISLRNAGDQPRVVVKLEGSDLVLLQPSSRIAGKRAAAAALPNTRSPRSLDWMRSRGWLEQMDVDLLKAIQQFGVYDRSLRLARAAERAAGTAVLNPEKEARELLELLRMERVTLVEENPAGIAAVAAERKALAASTPEPVVALWCAWRESLLLLEGSHTEPETAEGSLHGAIDYQLGPDRLLLLDLRCRFGAHAGTHAGPRPPESHPPAEALSGLRLFMVAPKA